MSSLVDGLYVVVSAGGFVKRSYRAGHKLYASKTLAIKAAKNGSVYRIILTGEGMVIDLVHGPAVALPQVMDAPKLDTAGPPRRCEPISDSPPSKAKWACTGLYNHAGDCQRTLVLDYYGKPA